MGGANVEWALPRVLRISVLVLTIEKPIGVAQYAKKCVGQPTVDVRHCRTYRWVCNPCLLEREICLAENHGGNEALHISDKLLTRCVESVLPNCVVLPVCRAIL